jgi:hypothetical protein
MVVSVQSAMVSRFCVRPTSKKWFLKIVQVTMKHDPIRCHVGSHVDFTSILHAHTLLVPPSSIMWSSELDTFSTNESAWSVMVTGSPSRVWSGLELVPDDLFWGWTWLWVQYLDWGRIDRLPRLLYAHGRSHSLWANQHFCFCFCFCFWRYISFTTAMPAWCSPS